MMTNVGYYNCIYHLPPPSDRIISKTTGRHSCNHQRQSFLSVTLQNPEPGRNAVVLKENIWGFGGFVLEHGETAVFSFNYTTNFWTRYPKSLQAVRYGHRSGTFCCKKNNIASSDLNFIDFCNFNF